MPSNIVPFILWLTPTVYGVVRRASLRAIVAPHSLYTLLCVVSCGVHVGSYKYTINWRGATNSGRWYVISRRVAFGKRDSTCRRQLHTNGWAMVSLRNGTQCHSDVDRKIAKKQGIFGRKFRRNEL